MKYTRRVFLRNAVLTSGALTLRGLPAQAQSRAVSAEPEAVDTALVRRRFQSPPRKYGPLVRWWWPGNDVEDSVLLRQIDALDKAGFAGAEIQPFVKGFLVKDLPHGQAERVNSYATPSFFRHVAVVIEAARSRGMFIDYTFGSGWPFGGSAITPELASVELHSSHLFSIEGPTKFHQRLQFPPFTDGHPLHSPEIYEGLPDGWAERMIACTKVVAVVAVRGTDVTWYFNQDRRSRAIRKSGELEAGTAVDLTSRLQSDGTLTWDVPPGTWQLFVFYSMPTGERVNAGAGPGPQLVMDHLSAKAFAAHAQHVGGNAIPYIGKYFGNGLRAIFCDSLEVGGFHWTGDFIEQFRQRRGYSIIPYLPILQVQSYKEPFGKWVDFPIFDMPGIGDQVRHDYHHTVSDLMIENMYEQFNKWARDHNLLSRVQAHGSPTDVLRVYGEANIPETEDLYDDGGYDFLKMAGSAAHVYGRAIVGSESFVWSDAVYETTPEKMKIASDQLLTAGVNAIVYHGFPYLVPWIPAPGWEPFNGLFSGVYSSQLNELNTFWPYFGQLNSYIARVQYISQVGKNVAAVALFRNDFPHGAAEAPPVPKLNQAIMDAGYNYDHINAHSLLQCTVSNGMLVTAGGARYQAFVYPVLDAIDAALAVKLQTFAAAGLPILFAGPPPAHAVSLLDNAQNTQRVQAAMHAMSALRNVHSCAGIDGVIFTLGKTAHPNIRFHSTPLSFIQKRIGTMNTYFLRNESDTLRHLDAEFEAEGEPELWDPWTGKPATIASYQRKGQWVQVTLDLQPFASALIVFDPDRAAAPAAVVSSPRSVEQTEEIGAAGWNLAATGLVPSGKTAVIHRQLPVLIDWSLDSKLRGFSGRGVYSTTFTVSAAHSGKQLILNLGDVQNVAEVTVNGKQVATLLLRPYRIDVTDFVHLGENRLELAVTNSLFNCMALRNPRPFIKGPTDLPSGLMSSGLLGPVEIEVMS